MTEYLKHLPVLVIDCQTTGASPYDGRLLEIGWAGIRASDPEGDAPEMECWLLDAPDNPAIPRRVSMITGITQEDLRDARPSAEAWARLEESANALARLGERETCPAVIHYSRFEEPFLRKLHRDHSPESPFPLTFICTHEIARRLFPGLPRRGLRAVAGYLGYSAAEPRRTSHHVSATVWIWRKMVELLETERGIRTLDDLLDWLAATPVSSRTGREWPMDRDIRLGLPDRPGVYRMLRSNRDVLYVGKAESLKRRVNSYFQKRTSHAEHILEMLSQAKDLEVTLAGSALEAALLETDEIKRLDPPYNISLRAADRTLRFCSRDFRRFRAEAGEDVPVGPFSSDDVAVFPVIRDLLESDSRDLPDESDTPARALGIPLEYAPGRECFLRGFEQFSEIHGAALREKSFPGAFLLLGAQLWRNRVEKDEMIDGERESPAEEAEPEPSPMGEWTPENVAENLERAILRGAWLVRRARWFCALTESALLFREPRDSAGTGRLLVIERGTVIHREDPAIDREIPAPPGWRRSDLERQRNFDLTVWDRMRVLTTELRRIISRGGDASLRLSTRKPLSREKLEKVLSWV